MGGGPADSKDGKSREAADSGWSVLGLAAPRKAIGQLTPMAYGALPTASIRHRMPSKKETPWDSCGLKPLRIPPKFCVLSPEE